MPSHQYECACASSYGLTVQMLTCTRHTRTVSCQCAYAYASSDRHDSCTCMNTPHTRTASRQCGCACDASYCYDHRKCMNTPHTRTASRQCECACEPSDYQLGCTCNHTYHKRTVARQCVSLHDCHSLISSCSDVSMPSSSTCARPPRVQCEEGREQARAQRHLRGNTKQTYTVSEGMLSPYANTSSHTTACMPCPEPRVQGAHAHERRHADACRPAALAYGYFRCFRVGLW